MNSNSVDDLSPIREGEPHPARFAGTGWQTWLKARFWAARPMFFTAAILPVVVGTAWGYRISGGFDGLALLLALAAVVCVHGAANVLNDVYDDGVGSDRDNSGRIFPYTGGSRFIQNGVLSAKEMAAWGKSLLAAGLLLGVLLIVLKSWPVLAMGLIGLALGVAYSMPPLRLSDRALGEIAVGIGFGVLPIVGAAWLQSGRFDAGGFLVSLPVSCWIANVLLINEVPDCAADRRAGRRNWVVRFGTEAARQIYLALNLAAIAVGAGMGWAGFLPGWTFAGLAVLLVPALRAAYRLPTAPRAAIESTLAIHAVGSLWLVAAILASPLS